jgi:hypothetical protein
MADNDKGKEPLTDKEKVIEEQILKNQDAINEIERRRKVRDETPEELVPYDIPSSSAHSLRNIHGYDFAVINKAHIKMNPPCKRPGFRILGLFREGDGEYDNWLDELRDQGIIFWDDKTNQSTCKWGDMHKLPLMKYGLLSKTPEKDRSHLYVTNKIELLKKLHMENIQFSKQEFAETRKGTSQGKMGLSIDKQREKAQEKRKKLSREQALNDKSKAEHVSKQEVARVPRSMQLMQQLYAVIIVMHDISTDVLSAKADPEPAIMIVDAFDTCDDAIKYIETLKNDVFLMNIDVVTMYVWIYPEDVKYDQVEEKYRNPEQNLIMQGKKNACRDIKNAESEAKIKGVNIATTDVVVGLDSVIMQENPLDAYDIKKNKKMTYEEDVDIKKLVANAQMEEAKLPASEVQKIDEIYGSFV